MYIIPEVKSYTPCDKFVIDGCNFTFAENIDERVKILAKKVTVGNTNVEVKVEENGRDAYKLSTAVAAAEMAETITVQVFTGCLKKSILIWW